jgi:hypothetical protein
LGLEAHPAEELYASLMLRARASSDNADLARSLATAKTLAEMVELRATYWRKQFSALAAQAEEVRALSTKVAGEMAEPIKAHMKRSVDELRKAT